jgi:hypothetical protein
MSAERMRPAEECVVLPLFESDVGSTEKFRRKGKEANEDVEKDFSDVLSAQFSTFSTSTVRRKGCRKTSNKFRKSSLRRSDSVDAALVPDELLQVFDLMPRC